MRRVRWIGLVLALVCLAVIVVPVVHAAYQDIRVGGTGIASHDQGKWFSTTIRVDLATNTLGSGEIAYFWNVPAETYIHGVLVDVVTPEGGTLTFDVGDYSAIGTVTTVDGYIDGADGNDTAIYLLSHANGEAYAVGKAYPTASILGLIANNAADAAVIDVTIFGCPIPEIE